MSTNPKYPAIGRSRMLTQSNSSSTLTTNTSNLSSTPSNSSSISPLNRTTSNTRLNNSARTPNEVDQRSSGSSDQVVNNSTKGQKSIAEMINERLHRKSIPYKSLAPLSDDTQDDDKPMDQIEDQQDFLQTLANQFSITDVPQEDKTASRASQENRQYAAFIQSRSEPSATEPRVRADSRTYPRSQKVPSTQGVKPEENQDVQSNPSLFTRVVRAAKKILEHVKMLKDLKVEENGENQILDLAKATARSTIGKPLTIK